MWDDVLIFIYSCKCGMIYISRHSPTPQVAMGILRERFIEIATSLTAPRNDAPIISISISLIYSRKLLCIHQHNLISRGGSDSRSG